MTCIPSIDKCLTCTIYACRKQVMMKHFKSQSPSQQILARVTIRQQVRQDQHAVANARLAAMVAEAGL